LENILPSHVARHFLEDKVNSKSKDLYHEARDYACIIFITITDFSKFYMELDANNEGVECLRLLNEIISDFDDLLDRDEFKCIEKIKTISTTYMAASGLYGKVSAPLILEPTPGPATKSVVKVTEETKSILEKEGFQFECRGEINVKGKGLMTTYFLVSGPYDLQDQVEQFV
ncbi:adenylate/guanylate cyclase catalytic domain protein, partial [Ancylostoma duodenale]